ncbi:hypothetical protein DFJ73DRAFT_852017 [Zopfochytrium polystomum]|nr:hypothetical protein DFJ73DRAFT_852017 [Zopfochytrium polystomum]
MSSSSTSTSNTNHDEALRCLDESKKKFEAGDVDGAIRFAKKSLTLAQSSLETLEKARHSGAASAAPRNGSSQLLQFLPFLLILAFCIFFSFVGDSTNNSATFSFERTRTYSLPRSTPNHNVAYFVSPTEWKSKKYDTSPRRVEALDNKVESHMINNLLHMCSRERENRSQHIAAAYTLFGVHQGRLTKAQAMPMPSCDKLVEWERVSDEIRRGLRVRKEKVGATDATGTRTEL